MFTRFEVVHDKMTRKESKKVLSAIDREVNRPFVFLMHDKLSPVLG